MTERFAGFPAEGLALLTELGRSDKAWFDEHRSTYTETVVAPMKAFVTDLGEALVQDISPGIVAQPKTNGSIGPINNDLRFSPSKAPYKDHVLLRFWDGPTKKTAPTLMVRISASTIGYASGSPIPSTSTWRELIDEESTGAELAEILSQIAVEHSELDVDGAELKRVPKPYPEDHPRGDLLRHKSMIQARWSEPTPALVHSSEFVDHCLGRLQTFDRLHHWFLEFLTS